MKLAAYECSNAHSADSNAHSADSNAHVRSMHNGNTCTREQAADAPKMHLAALPCTCTLHPVQLRTYTMSTGLAAHVSSSSWQSTRLTMGRGRFKREATLFPADSIASSNVVPLVGDQVWNTRYRCTVLICNSFTVYKREWRRSFLYS